MTSEVLFHVHFRATHHLPASCWGDLTKALDQPAGLWELCASPTPSTSLGQADAGLDWAGELIQSSLTNQAGHCSWQELSELPAGGQDELEGLVVPRCPWPACLLSV